MEFIGRLHPLLVHLPIGILLLVVLFEWLPFRKPYKSLRRSIRIILWLGFFAALSSVVSGLLLKENGDYEWQSVKQHQFAGIALTLITGVYAWARGQKQFKRIYKFLSVLMLALIIVTGHLGGTLTHGEGFLFEAKSNNADLAQVNLQQAHFYNDLVQPILDSKCYACHGSGKQKGKLRLDAPEHILKGGKGGVVLVAGKTDESEMINRTLLPLDDDDHMPPKEKAQLTPTEIEILKLWISSGADFNKSVIESNQLTALQKIISTKATSMAEVPEGNTDAADQKIIQSLSRLGAVVLPVADGSNYISVNLVNVTAIDSSFDLLVKLKQQLVWLKAGDLPVADSHLDQLSQLTQLSKLSLERTAITDSGLTQLNTLTNLQYLNLNQTKITTTGIKSLEGLKNLQSLYIYGTGAKATELAALQQAFPNTKIEFGNYIVPTLETDTTILK
ncbi:MAG TPA: hypothetical protein DHV26_07455 [Cytophagales bacterium]|nr:hypothetical protein [Cytophagales bacterium]HRG07508.1 hypothetical protein [Cyclobacteriaceae bacterium]